MDPFQNLPVDAWEPPKKALISDKKKWKDKQGSMMTKIRLQTFGGPKLRDFIAEEVRAMEQLRIDLFCTPYKEEMDANGGGSAATNT